MMTTTEEKVPFKVVWTVTECKEDVIYASSIDAAKQEWEGRGLDGELFFIQGPDGKQVIYD